MENMEKIKAHYGFTSDDVGNLMRLRPLMEPRQGEFVEEFYRYIKNLEDAPKFLKDDEIIRKHRDAVGKWFLNLFSGEYGRDYFKELERVGTAHVKINLPAHYVNSTMHFTARYLSGVLQKLLKDERELSYVSGSVEKILDMNLDVFTSSYIEEEKKLIFISQRVEGYLIRFAKRFTYGMNLVLVVGLVALGVMVLGLFAYDLSHVFYGNIEKGLLSALGTLLMLWVVIELMDTEIQHLRGKKFAIKVFVSVALVAIIRKILITSISQEHEVVGAQLSLVAAVAVLGGVYWLIAKVEH